MDVYHTLTHGLVLVQI